MAEPHPMRQFLLFVFTLLIPCFVLWTVASNQLASPAVGIVNMILTHWFPDVVNALTVDGKGTLLMTQFGEANGNIIPLAGAEYRLGFQINPGILSYSLPFYTALHFATQKTYYLHTYLWGVLTLYFLMTIGLLCLCMKELMVNLGTNFLDQPGVYVPDPNLIGLAYQLSVLIVPTLGPAALWLWQSKDSPLLQDLLRKTFPTKESNP